MEEFAVATIATRGGLIVLYNQSPQLAKANRRLGRE
jgi:hypothetical protein